MARRKGKCKSSFIQKKQTGDRGTGGSVQGETTAAIIFSRGVEQHNTLRMVQEKG